MKHQYTPFDVAVFFASANLTIVEEQSVLASIWQQQNDVLDTEHRQDMKVFMKAVYQELDKINGQSENDDEINLIFREMGSKYMLGNSNYDDTVISSFFKVIALLLTYSPRTDHYKIKLRNLIALFGYKKRSKDLVNQINSTIDSLQLRVYLRGRASYDICDIPLIK